MRHTATDAAIRIRSSTCFSSRSVHTWHGFRALRSGFRAEDDGCCVAEERGSCLKRIDVEGLSPSHVQEKVDFHTPCILTGALKLTTCEAWCDTLMESLGDSEVEYQIRDNDSGRSEMFRSTLTDFIYDLQEESTHDQSWYLLDEHLLDDPRVSPATESTFRGLQQLLGRDEFELFPPSVRPQKSCLIVGGMGARSFLHGDPMEWLGWNVLLEGRKLWTFLPLSPELDASLGTYRLAPNAFGEHNISAGWQSDVDLYRRRTSASWSLAREEQEIWRLTTSGVQEPGDIVIIPPRYWHQVYHLEPSVAVASQHMNHHVRRGVFRHILDWCGAGEVAFPVDFDQLTLPQQVRYVLRAALVAQLGQERGLEAFANLKPPR